jgi:hypothetical protein
VVGSKIPQPQLHTHRGVILVAGIQQDAPDYVSRIRYEIGENGALGAAKHFRRQYRPLSTLLQLESPHDFLVSSEDFCKPLGAGRLGFVAINVDADDTGVPAREPFQEIGELSIPQWPIKIGDVVLGPPDEKYPSAWLMTGPRDPKRIVDQELERLQPAVAPGKNDPCD